MIIIDQVPLANILIKEGGSDNSSPWTPYKGGGSVYTFLL